RRGRRPRARAPALQPLGGFEIRSGAGPSIIASLFHNAGANGVLFDVVPNFLELLLVAYGMVIAFFLPEGLSSYPQHHVGTLGRDPFQRFSDPWKSNLRGDQDMHMIRHDYEGMQEIVPQLLGVVLNRLDHHFGNRDLSQVESPGA